ncbi:hypothetical protein [Geomonas propionica]|uniref:Uncharacterized protein n=1 Tax=Geomonas propionica TaxID=2798582 RepID=A0ABS0YP82_9BACT|nr:hypothetical protein [Geomonas propionica]MBJ6799731.1 hypothetical protein [Geomonas propionica]
MTEQAEMYAPGGGISNPLDTIFTGMKARDPIFELTLQNLAGLPTLNEVEGHPMPGKAFHQGVMGYRRNANSLRISVGCGRAMVRHIEPAKFIAMAENMHEDRLATVVLENFTDGERDGRMPRGQVLGRINPDYSCIVIAQGLTGRVIHGTSDLVRLDAYYVAKDLLAGFYLSAKLQHGVQSKLDELIGSFDGWKAYDIPRDPCAPEL